MKLLSNVDTFSGSPQISVTSIEFTLTGWWEWLAVTSSWSQYTMWAFKNIVLKQIKKWHFNFKNSLTDQYSHVSLVVLMFVVEMLGENCFEPHQTGLCLVWNVLLYSEVSAMCVVLHGNQGKCISKFVQCTQCEHWTNLSYRYIVYNYKSCTMVLVCDNYYKNNYRNNYIHHNSIYVIDWTFDLKLWLKIRYNKISATLFVLMNFLLVWKVALKSFFCCNDGNYV